MATGFHFPYYGGGGPVEVEPPYAGTPQADRPIPYTVSLAGVEYGVDLANYRRRSLDSFQQGVVESDQPDDSQFNNEGGWWRYVYDWEDGAGQTVQDFGENVSPARFAESRGIDCWTEYQLKLLNATDLKEAAAADNVLLIATGQFVYMADGTGVKRASDPDGTWSSVTGLTGTVRDFATDGVDIYIGTPTHIYTVSDGGGLAATQLTTISRDFQKVAFVSNRLLAASDNQLYEIDGAGASATVGDAHFQASFRYTTIFNIGSRIYVGGFAGNRSELYSITTDSSGNIVLSAEAAAFAYGELLRTAVSYAGVVIIATSLGVRLGTLSGDGSLSYGPLIEAPGDVQCLVAEGSFVWFGWQSMFSDAAGVGRLALDNTPRPLQPAYATDVFTTLDTDVVSGVARFNGITLFGVAGSGVYGETSSPVTSGYLKSGQVYLGTVERKKLRSIRADFDELVANQSVNVSVEDEHGHTLGTQTAINTGEQMNFELLSTHDDAGAWCRVTITMATTSTSPCFRRWRIRGIPIVPMVEEWIVPLILHKYGVVNDGVGQLRSYDQLAQAERLIDLCESKRTVAYREGVRTYAVRIDKYEMQPREWDDTSDFFDSLFVVRLISEVT